MWTVVGLGNPGPRYENTRHNVGFMVVERLARRWDATLQVDADGRARRAEATFADRPTRLVQPLVFMNRSGMVLDVSVMGPDVIAIYDDLDLAEGRLRIRPRGGTGGHRGVASLIERLGEQFTRLRVGVGRPPAGMDPAEYVLEPLSPDAATLLGRACDRACEAVESIITEGPGAAMNRFNAAAGDAV